MVSAHALAARTRGNPASPNDTDYRYGWALFKALSHMLCIGYGRDPPQIISEVWLTIFSMLIGATFYALFIGQISSIMLRLDSAGRMYAEKASEGEGISPLQCCSSLHRLFRVAEADAACYRCGDRSRRYARSADAHAQADEIAEYMRCSRIPFEVRDRVRRFMEYRYPKRKYFREGEILTLLSPSLAAEIKGFVCKGVLESLALFQGSPPAVIDALRGQLLPDVALEGEDIVR